MARPHSRCSVLLVLLVVAAILAGCGADEEGTGAGGGTGGGGTPPGTAIRADAFEGARFTVGSKEFPEQLILGQIAIEALEAGGALVRDRTGIEGSEATRRALTSGEIDMYWEYTGTAQLTYLDQEPVRDPARQYEAVARADRANGIAWLDPAPASNAFGLAVRREARRALDVETISDFARLVERAPDDATLCVAEEFKRRADGLPGLERAYGFSYPDERLVTLEEDAIYDAIDSGAQCTFGEVFLTDGRIVADELYVLEDDERVFTTYNPALTVRQEVLARHPRLEDLFGDIAAVLDDATLRELSAEVVVRDRRADEVARDFLDANGFTG